MSFPLPSSFNVKLSSDRLQMIANWLLEELYNTQDDLTRATDSSYGRGCTTFDRQRNRIIQEAVSGDHPWLGLENSTFALVFTIGGVPCRFSNDDPANPSKGAVLLTNPYQSSFLEFVEEGTPGRFCFVVDRGFDGIGEPRVEFLGFSVTGDLVCKWVSDSTRVLYATGVPESDSVEVGKPQVTPKRPDTPAVTETPEAASGDTNPEQ
ncbi:hypothetical protein [Dyella kyungheensis]|uniref:Uncharacterized protein n=1 Tax=Dyella kyungheensis TaxID=1242174 RepID=A0ABS2JP66_9GAMM|nr:hypothetical protein [Dyella kyungheensis]MBM7120222.1 hypothetical protein [Dyella kyungheensis]